MEPQPDPTDALALVVRLRGQLGATRHLSRDAWAAAAYEARRDGEHGTLAHLLGIELPAAVVDALASLAAAAEHARGWPDATSSAAWGAAVLGAIEGATGALHHAWLVLGFVVGPDPCPEHKGLGVLLRAGQVEFAAVDRDVRPVVADALDAALAQLVEPLADVVGDLERWLSPPSFPAELRGRVLDAYQAAGGAGVALGSMGACSCSSVRTS